jgi:hypothetical protein
VAYVEHRTLTANVVTPVTFTANASVIEVATDGAAELYFTTDGTTPTVGGQNCHWMQAAIGSVEVLDDTAGQNSVVKLISSGTPKVSVTAK